MRVVGIDPGFVRLGLGAVTVKESGTDLLTYGLITNVSDPSLKFNQNLNLGIKQITQDLPMFLDMTRPQLIVAEFVPVGKLGSNDALVIAAITACKVIAFQFGIEWTDIAASTVKTELTGDKDATKVKVRNAIFEMYPSIERKHLELKRDEKAAGEKPEGLPFDVFDAVGIATVGAKLRADKNVQEVQGN